jgi:hypothetical protein
LLRHVHQEPTQQSGLHDKRKQLRNRCRAPSAATGDSHVDYRGEDGDKQRRKPANKRRHCIPPTNDIAIPTIEEPSTFQAEAMSRNVPRFETTYIQHDVNQLKEEVQQLRTLVHQLSTKLNFTMSFLQLDEQDVKSNPLITSAGPETATVVL